jgi:hypothetical protein
VGRRVKAGVVAQAWAKVWVLRQLLAVPPVPVRASVPATELVSALLAWATSPVSAIWVRPA